MNFEVLKTKTALASLALLVLSGVRVAAGDATALQGVQEAIMSLVPIFLRLAVGNASNDAAQAAEQGAAQGAREAIKDTAGGQGAQAPDRAPQGQHGPQAWPESGGG